jgi:hypothetical protein
MLNAERASTLNAKRETRNERPRVKGGDTMVGHFLALPLRSSSLDGGELVFVVAFTALITWLVHLWVSGYRERAQRGDHVVETSRDVAVVADHCTDCGAPHPQRSLQIFPRRPHARSGVISESLTDKGKVRLYRFPFCQRCAAPILRRRRLGFFLKLACIVPLLHLLLILFGWPIRDLFFAAVPKSTWWFRLLFGLEMAIPDIFAAFLLFMAGLFLSVSAPPVMIIDPQSGDRILFAFRNQVYRNHFAELNGEDNAL